MLQQIITKLQSVKQEYGVKILYACESGSRAWGFEGVDSDYDVRFVYAKTREEYLSLKEQKPEINLGVNDKLDIVGWDIRKTLLLLQKSNTTVCEWAASPIVYMDDGFRRKLSLLVNECFLPKVAIHHYLGSVKGYEAELEGDEIELKKLFYMLRAVYTARFIAEFDIATPINLGELRSAIRLDGIDGEIDALLQIKRSVVEKATHKISKELKEFIKSSCANLKAYADGLPRKEKTDIKLLDKLFFEYAQ